MVFGANSTHSFGSNILAKSHYGLVRHRLAELGLSRFALRRRESRYLPQIIAIGEKIGGAVYGKHNDGLAMLVATDKRIIFLDKKPLFVNEEEINYNVVSGVSMSNVGLLSIVTLNTRVKDYSMKTFNQKSAHNFIKYIEQRSIEYQQNLYSTA